MCLSKSIVRNLKLHYNSDIQILIWTRTAKNAIEQCLSIKMVKYLNEKRKMQRLLLKQHASEAEQNRVAKILQRSRKKAEEATLNRNKISVSVLQDVDSANQHSSKATDTINKCFTQKQRAAHPIKDGEMERQKKRGRALSCFAEQ